MKEENKQGLFKAVGVARAQMMVNELLNTGALGGVQVDGRDQRFRYRMRATQQPNGAPSAAGLPGATGAPRHRWALVLLPLSYLAAGGLCTGIYLILYLERVVSLIQVVLGYPCGHSRKHVAKQSCLAVFCAVYRSVRAVLEQVAVECCLVH